jgi:hypothetical protein
MIQFYPILGGLHPLSRQGLLKKAWSLPKCRPGGSSGQSVPLMLFIFRVAVTPVLILDDVRAAAPGFLP